MEKQTVDGRGRAEVAAADHPALQARDSHPGDSGVTDLAFDWLSILKKKCETARAYADYLNDVRNTNAPQCVELMRRLWDMERQQIAEIKEHVLTTLSGRMGKTGVKPSKVGSA